MLDYFKLQRVRDCIPDIRSLNPDAIVLDLGANDLDCASRPDPEFVAADVVEFANLLLYYYIPPCK